MWYWLVRIFFKIVMSLFFRLKVEGKENLPKHYNYIIAVNHASFLDPAVVGSVIPHKIYSVAMRDIYRIPWIKWLLPKLDVMPTGNFSRKAIDLLMNGQVVGLFPEGGCSHDGKLKEFRRGAALLAFKTGRPIVPCAVFGTYEALPVKKSIPKLVPLKLKIGKPIYFLKEFEEVIDDIKLQEGTFRIRNAIKEMIDAG